MSHDAELKTLNDAICLRGLFIQRYSGIEFSLTELIMRARQHTAYKSLGDLPFRFDRKLKRLNDVIERDGPISSYGPELLATFGNFAEFAERRHFLVHGIMTIPKNAVDRTTLGFRMYDHKKVVENGEKSSVVHIGRMDATLEQLELLAASLQPIATAFPGLVARICREVPLPFLYEQALESCEDKQ